MLSVIVTIWLLLQLPVGLALGRFIGCPKRAMKRTEARHPPTSTATRTA
jgi:uncharacterized protein YneF (UPF0154 family)